MSSPGSGAAPQPFWNLEQSEGGLQEEEGAVAAPPAQVAEQVARWRELAGRWESEAPFDQEVAAIEDARTAGRVVTW